MKDFGGLRKNITEDRIAALEKKAQKSGIPYGILKKVYDRGMAAWKGVIAQVPPHINGLSLG